METYVVSEIIKSYYHAGKRPNLYYYRDTNQREIDLLVAEGDWIYPMEIKKAKTPRQADRHFPVLEKLGKKVQPGVILCMVDELLPYSRRAWCFPVAAL